MLARNSRFVLLIFLLSLSLGLAHAQTLSVSPSQIVLSPLNPSQSVTVNTTPAGTADLQISLNPPQLGFNYVDVPATAVAGTPFTISLRPNAPPIDCTTQCSMRVSVAGQTNAINVPVFISSTGTTTGINLSSSNVTFNFPVGSFSVLPQSVTISSAQTVNLAVSVSQELFGLINVPQTVLSNGTLTISVPSPSLITSARTGRITLTPPAGTGLSAQQITVSLVPGGTGTGTNLQAFPSAITFSYQQGSTQQIQQVIQLSAPISATVSTSFTGPLAAFAQAFSIPTSTTSNSQVPITLLAPQFITSPLSGTLTFTPQAGSGLAATQVTISTNPGGTGTGGITLTPSALVFPNTSSTAVQQFVQISAPTVGQVPLTATLSSNLAVYFSVPSNITTNQQIPITLNFPQSTPTGTQGTLTLTPPPGFGLAPVVLSISVGNQGGGGTGSVVANPASLSFTTRVNTPAQPQQVTLTGLGFGTAINATPSLGSNFLQVSQSGFISPLTLTVRIDPTFITAPGTYNGSIDVTSGGILATRIPVTVTVQPNVAVTPTPTEAALTAAAGSTTAATASITLTAEDNTIPFTATTSTTTGGSSWLTVTPSSGNLGSAITISANASGLQPGTYNGSVTIASQGGTVATIPVTFTVTSSATLQLSASTLTFAHQTTSTTAPASQTVQITSSGPSLTWTATPTSTGGWLQVTPATGNTGQALSVAVVPTGLAAGSYEGTIRVASAGATNSPQTITVRLTVTTPTIPAITSVVNGASFAPTVAVPGLIMTIRGTDLGPAAPGVAGTVDAQNQLSTEVSGVRVLFDNTPAPILFASANQINVVVPYEIANRVSTRLTVTAQNQTSRELELRVGDTAPALFTANASGSGQGAILNQNGSVNSATNAEQRGNIVVLYGTGQGQSNPAGTTGLVLGSGPRLPLVPVSVRIGGLPAEVLYAGSAPGLISGAMQINVRIPQNAGTGALPVDVQIGNAVSQAGVTVAVQ